MAKRYARQPIADEAAYRRKLEVTRTYFRPDMHVLEFGCGTGSTALAMLRMWPGSTRSTSRTG